MEASKAVNLIRNMRHDFGNHLQIINGYSELGYLDEVKEYVLEIVNEMNQERDLFELDNPELTLFLLHQKLLIKEIGVILNYDSIDISSDPNQLMDRFELLPLVKPIIEGNSRNNININVSIYELDDQFKIVINSEHLRDKFQNFYIKKG